MAYVLASNPVLLCASLSDRETETMSAYGKRGASEMNLFLYLTRLLLHKHADIQNSRFPERTKQFDGLTEKLGYLIVSFLSLDRQF